MSVVLEVPGETALEVPVDPTASWGDLQDAVHAHLNLRRPAACYTFEILGVDGCAEVVHGDTADPTVSLEALGILGTGERITVTLQYKHVASARLLERGVTAVNAPERLRQALADADDELLRLYAAGMRDDAAFGSTVVGLYGDVVGGAAAAKHVRFLIDAGVPVDVPSPAGRTPLHDAARRGSVEVVAMMLAAGAPVNQKCTDITHGRPMGPALRLACMRPHSGEDVVTALCKAGADVEWHDDDGWTPMHEACDSRATGCVRALLAAGARPDRADVAGWRPLGTACDQGVYGIAELLVAAGADVNAVTPERWTPLHGACAGCAGGDHMALEEVTAFVRTARLLLAAGASSGKVSAWGTTPDVEALERAEARLAAGREGVDSSA